MERQPNLIVKSLIKPNKDESSPTKCTPTTKLAPATSTSKVLIITPEQIAKLGLTQQINKAVQSQVAPSTSSKSEPQEIPRRKNVRISKITIINPKPSVVEEPEVKLPPLVKFTNMKSKLSNLLKSRPPLQIPSTSCNKILKIDKTKPEGRKRKLLSFDKDEDDDVILVDNEEDTKVMPIKVEEVEKPHQSMSSVIVKNELNDNEARKAVNNSKIRPSRIKPIPNIIRKSMPSKDSINNVQERKVNKALPVKDTLQMGEDLKNKIHVLSNEQISLPRTYIASLKSQLSERLAKPNSTPFLIYKSSSNLDVKPIIDLVKEEPDEVDIKIELDEPSDDLDPLGDLETDKQLTTVLIVKEENLDTTPPVEDNNSIVVLNDSFNSEVSSGGENKITDELNIEENSSVIDLTETVEDETQKKVKKINKPKEALSPETKIQLKNAGIKKTYSKQTNLLLETEELLEAKLQDPEVSPPEIITPKKRGRKKKSEMIQEETITSPNIPEPEIEMSRRGRKRKVVDYFALSEGNEYDEPQLSPAKKTKKQTLDHEILEIDTTISCNPEDNTINCTYTTSQEITPKRKRGRPPKKKAVVEDQIEEVSLDKESIDESLVEKQIDGGKTKEIDSNAVKETNEVASTSENKTIEINSDDSKETNEDSSIEEIKSSPSKNVEDRSGNAPTHSDKIQGNTSEAEKINEVDTNVSDKTTEGVEKTNENLTNEAVATESGEKTNESIVNETLTNEARNMTKTIEDVTLDNNQTNDAKEMNEVETTVVAIEPNETSTNQATPKKRRGRSCKNGPQSELLNTIFQQMNTPSTLDVDNSESVSEACIEDRGVIENTPEIATIYVKPEFNKLNFEEQPKKSRRTKKKRGRPKTTPLESDPVEETSTSSNQDNLMVTCAVCNKEVTKLSWTNHKQRFHNNLAWKIGEPPLDLNDQKFVMRVLSDLYKRKKPLFCEKCGESKKSVIGFLSHKTMCQKSTEELTAMRIKCEFCDRTVLPVSMSIHLKFCRESGDNSSFDDNNSVLSLNDSPQIQGKRRAAQKADGLIKSLKDDDEVETNANKKHSKRWYVNFDFKPTYFGKKRFRTEISKNGIAKCRFEGCNYETSDVEEISNHLYTCDKKPTQGFTCKFCIKTFETHPDVLEHLKEAHASVNRDETSAYEERSEGEELEEEFLDDSEETDKIIVKPKVAVGNRANLLHGIKFLLEHRYCVPNTQIAYPPALDWTLQFCNQNFSISNLFPNWRTASEHWEKLRPEVMANYLPHLKYSACTSVVENNKFVDPLKLNHEWKRYKLFEGTSCNNGSSMIFCGGPIISMAWAPTPHREQNCDQILAISSNQHPNKEYTFDIKYSEPGLIQFWNCGPLLNESNENQAPKLEFCIAHNYGPIWHLEWCPSGCYDISPDPKKLDSLQRLGVLAIASGNSHIYLYSICKPGEISGKIFKPKPILKLTLESVIEHIANDLESQVTKISWSKASGHRYLVAGYANGLVAAYDLSTTSTLLNLGPDGDGIKMIMPYRVFPAHHHAITALSLYHLNDGRRWIITGSVDRTTKYWDLENPIVPITNFSKYIVTDGVWLSHWLSSLHCFDDSCTGGLTFTVAHQPRNFESESTSVMHSNSRVTSITGSEWINGFVQGNVVGELQGFFPHQMFFSMDGDKSFRNKKVMLGYTRLVEKDLTISQRVLEEKFKLEQIYKKPKPDSENKPTPIFSKVEPTTYKEAAQKYGLVFSDFKLNSGKEFNDSIKTYQASNKLQKFYTTRPNIYPLQSITNVAFNPNQGSYLYLATGYQAGFVKISYMQFFNGKRK